MSEDASTSLHLRDLSLRTKVVGTFLILFLLAAVVPGGTWFLLRKHEQHDAAVINEAGRQRMLVQKMVALANMIARGKKKRREELRATIARYEETLDAFQEGNLRQNLPGAPSRMQPQLRRVRSRWEAFRSRVETIAREPPSSAAFQEALAYVQRHSETLLRETDRTVQLYTTIHERWLEGVGQFLVWAAGGLLVVIGLFLYYAERHVARLLTRLKREAKAIAEGNFDREVTVVDSRDEIGALTRSIQEMKDRLLHALRETRIFRTAVEHAGHSIYWTSPEGRIEYVNPAFEEVTGYDREEAVGATPRMLQSGEHDESFYEDLWTTIKGGEVWQGEIVDQRPDGEQYVVNQTIAPVQNGRRQIEHFVAVGNDVTDRKKYERALRKERDRFATLFEGLPTPVAHCVVEEEETLILAVNEAFEDVFGVAASAAEGEGIDELLVPEGEREEAREIERRALEEGIQQAEVRRRTTSGLRDFQLQVAGRELEGRPPELYVIYTDITAQKRREQRLKRQNERLDRFAGVLSHDLRNPLNVAAGRLELARESDGAAAEGTGHLEAVARALGRMDQIIEDMLTLTWSEQALEADDVGTLSLRAMATACWGQVRTAEASLRIETDLRLRAHEGRLRRLLENLFRNAVEHGGEAVTVTVGALPDGFFVEDDGPGLPAEDEKVLEAGYSSREEGTGLGLSIVNAIAEAHGWTLSVGEGRKGGARFEIRGAEVESVRGVDDPL